MIHFTLLHPKATPEHLGFIPLFLSEADPRSAAEQFNSAYAHGGGWQPFAGFKLEGDCNLKYPGDPPIRAIAEAQLRQEAIVLYEHSWVAIFQPDGSFEISRMD